jgi:DNA adenine methylase
VTAQLTLRGLTPTGIQGSPQLTPFIKWPGGKSYELPAIAAAAPPLTGRLIDPFVGGGSVLLATPPEVPAWANDACADLARLYTGATSSDDSFQRALESVAMAWNGFAGLGQLYEELAATFTSGDGHAVSSILAAHAPAFHHLLDPAGPGLAGLYMTRIEKDLPVKFERMRRVQTKVAALLSAPDLLANVEGAIRAAMYMAIRSRYNRYRLSGEWGHYRSADFLFLREFAYAAMFRFNARDEFNVPYGGVSYNRKSLMSKVSLLFSEPMLERLSATQWRCLDFEPFLDEVSPTHEDFVFVDPPYDSDFSAYDNMPFGWRHQQRLQEILEGLSARVMVVIKDTPMIRRLYGSDRWNIFEAPKTYMWTIKSRNDREATHLTITNYLPGAH